MRAISPAGSSQAHTDSNQRFDGCAQAQVVSRVRDFSKNRLFRFQASLYELRPDTLDKATNDPAAAGLDLNQAKPWTLEACGASKRKPRRRE